MRAIVAVLGENSAHIENINTPEMDEHIKSIIELEYSISGKILRILK